MKEIIKRYCQELSGRKDIPIITGGYRYMLSGVAVLKKRHRLK